MNRRNHPCFRAALVMLALGLVMIAWPGRSQPVVGGQGFKFTEYYEAPHETQLKSLLECSQAQRLPDGRYLITECQRSNLPCHR